MQKQQESLTLLAQSTLMLQRAGENFFPSETLPLNYIALYLQKLQFSPSHKTIYQPILSHHEGTQAVCLFPHLRWIRKLPPGSLDKLKQALKGNNASGFFLEGTHCRKPKMNIKPSNGTSRCPAFKIDTYFWGFNTRHSTGRCPGRCSGVFSIPKTQWAQLPELWTFSMKPALLINVDLTFSTFSSIFSHFDPIIMLLGHSG